MERTHSKISAYFISMLFLLTSCDNLSYQKKVCDHIYIVSANSDEPRSISVEVGDGSYLGMVDGDVISFGVDESNVYVIANVNNKIKYYKINRIHLDPIMFEKNVSGPIEKNIFYKQIKSKKIELIQI